MTDGVRQSHGEGHPFEVYNKWMIKSVRLTVEYDSMIMILLPGGVK